jgi:hypothetical protein
MQIKALFFYFAEKITFCDFGDSFDATGDTPDTSSSTFSSTVRPTPSGGWERGVLDKIALNIDDDPTPRAAPVSHGGGGGGASFGAEIASALWATLGFRSKRRGAGYERVAMGTEDGAKGIPPLS